MNAEIIMGKPQTKIRKIQGITFSLAEFGCPDMELHTANAITVADMSTVDAAVAELEDDGYVVGIDVTYTIWASRVVRV